MFERTVLVPATSELLTHPSTQTLHMYDSGEALIRTTAPLSEASQVEETPVSSGVCLPEGSELRQVESARAPLTGLAKTDIISAYLEFIGPIDRTWIDTLNQLGIELLQFRPEHSFLSRGTVAAFCQALKQSFVGNAVVLEAGVKPRPITPESGEQEVWIVVQGDLSRADEIIQTLATLPDVTIDPHQSIDVVDFYLRLRATVSAEGQAALLDQASVLAIEPYTAPQPEDEVAGLILAGQYDSQGKPHGSYLRWLEDHGLNGEGVTIGIVDAGVDVSHPAFAGRIRDLAGDRRSWHGTFVAGHAAGCYLQEKDGNQFIYGLGMAPKADLLIQDNQSTPTALCRETVTEAGRSGWRGTVQNNSWGAGTSNPMSYGSQEATYDKLVRNADPTSPIPKPLTICFSAGNSGAKGLTRPKGAKNIIVTGNSESYRPEAGKDQSDNIGEVYTGQRGSSHGNCGDGRIVPHLVAPGEWTASANYDSNLGEKEYISAQITWGSGTSAASPKTAGACALLTQWWRQQNSGQDPSPAMLKALLVNGAEPMSAAGFVPNKLQGWGRLNLQNVLRQDIPRTYLNQTMLLKQRGAQQVWKIRVSDRRQPVKITLCWTDPPGGLNTGTGNVSAIVNKLALRVEVDGALYRGNQFQNGWSAASSSSDREGWDNLQNVFLAAGVANGLLQISVTALELTTNCLTGQIDVPQQDFALVISNGTVDVTTPASIFVAIDPAGQSSAKPKPSDRSSQSEHDDATDLHYDWWQTIHTSAGAGAPISTPRTQKDVNAWWLQDDVVWSKSESEKEGRTNGTIERSLQAGIEVITIGKFHQVLLPTDTVAETIREGETNPLTVVTANTQALVQTSPTLSATLAQLMANWNQFSSRDRQVGVLLVGSGSRISPADLTILRRLVLLGQLYLVSDDEQVLAFLAQRIHSRSHSLEFRLAENSQALPTLLRDTIVEASGGQRLAVTKDSTSVDGTSLSHCTFDVTRLDRQLTVRLQFPPDRVPQIDLYRPQQAPITILPTVESEGVQTLWGQDFVQFQLTASAVAWVGRWKLLLRQPGEESNQVCVWAWSDLQMQVIQQDLPNLSDRPSSAASTSEMLLTVSMSEGATLSRWQGQPRLMAESSIQQEGERSIEVVATASRSGQSRPVNESTQELVQPVRVSELGTVIHLPHHEGAIVVDLPLKIEGVDSTGNRFSRLLRRSVVQLEPRSQRRQRYQPATPLFTPAQIVGIEREGSEITQLTLQWNSHQRSIQVTCPKLQEQLQWLLQQDISKTEWIVGVVGQELYGLCRCLV